MRFHLHKKTREQKFEAIFHEFSDSIFRMCFFKTSDSEIAHDITQETFFRFWKTFSSDKIIDNEKAYLYRIANNLIIDYYKKNKTLSLETLSDQGIDFKSETLSAEIQADYSLVKEAMSRLDKDFSEVLYLRLIEGISVKEIAKILDITETLVSVRINRGKKKLKNFFEQQHE